MQDSLPTHIHSIGQFISNKGDEFQLKSPSLLQTLSTMHSNKDVLVMELRSMHRRLVSKGVKRPIIGHLRKVHRVV